MAYTVFQSYIRFIVCKFMLDAEQQLSKNP